MVFPQRLRSVMPIDPFNKDPFGSLSGIHDLHRLGEGPKDLAAQSLASIASPLSALDSLQASRQFDPATASALNDFQRFGQPPKDITAQSLASIVPPLSTLDSLQASRQFDPATAGAMRTFLAKPLQSVLDTIASARHGLQSISPLLSERIQHLIPEDIGVLARHRDMLDAVLPKWPINLADLSAANSFISADLAAAQSAADLNMPGLHAAMAKSTVADPLAGSAYRDATNFAKSLFDGVLSTSGILKDLTNSALDAAIAKSASLDSAEGMLARSAIKDLERFQSLAAQNKSVFETAAQFAAASIGSPFQGTLWGDRLQDAIVGVSLARTAGIDPHDFLFDSPELQAAEILDEANHLDPDDTAAALAWQTDAYRRIGEAFTKWVEKFHDAPPLTRAFMIGRIGMTILVLIGTIESSIQGFERISRWISTTPNTEHHQAADDFVQSRNDLLTGVYAAVSMVSALQQACYVTKHDAPVRATPGRTGKLIGHLPADTCVLVLERDGRWLRFAYQPPGTDASTETWVYRDHLMAATE
ncbi:hypothetical protein D3877_28905 [Azospirillum cavernae]|uniref:SH3 domain-containing protein n=2 Tax=Azospirillum cavernae TaxID=2320860 RepID=A0A418VKA0_9PROT|nr:hypothetical protein D3877_28905 [Azospirillum cavernae]